MKIKVIVIDLDGTLLNARKEVSRRNIKALGTAVEQGVKIVICSGRIFPEIMHFVKDIQGISYIASCNGAVVHDMKTREVIYDKAIPPSVFSQIVGELLQAPLFFNAYCGNDVYIDKTVMERSSLYQNRIEGLLCNYIITDRLTDQVASGSIRPNKIFAMSENSDCISDLKTSLSHRDDVEITSSYSNNFEITAKQVNKGVAIDFIGRRCQASRTEIMAIGDGENDLAMMQSAGMPVAMGNAVDVIRKYAKAITLGNNEDGVAAAVERFILGSKPID